MMQCEVRMPRESTMKLAVVVAIATAVITMVSKMTDLSSSTGALISQFGFSEELAFAIVTAFIGGGAYAISVLYPFLLPFVGIINLIIITAGVGAAVGY